MDVRMPVMDGLQATRAIREFESHTRGRVPIIAMTAHAQDQDHVRCLDAGMDGYLVKPVRKHELLEALAKHAPKWSGGPQPHQVNWDIVLESVGGDTQILLKVLSASLAECPEIMEKLRHAVQAGDVETVSSAAHSMKGAVRLLEVKELSEILERLESLCTLEELSAAESELARAQELWHQTKRQIEAFIRVSV
jgi:DNA-binding response OmpR family regulator